MALTPKEEIERKLTKRCTLKEASEDTEHHEYMTGSMLEVIDFDKMPGLYSQLTRRSAPKSNDALYIKSSDEWYFIEFKNGHVSKADVHDKIYDSIIMLIDLGIIPDFDFARKFIDYILVYNKKKNQGLKSPSNEAFGNYIGARAKTEMCFWGIDQFAGYILKEAHTYTQEEFHPNFFMT